MSGSGYVPLLLLAAILIALVTIVRKVLSMPEENRLHIALESTITGVGGGAESFSAFSASSVSAIPEPETYGMMLAGLGLMGMIVARRKKNI